MNLPFPKKNVSFGRQKGSFDNRAEKSPQVVSIFHSDSRTNIDVIIFLEIYDFPQKSENFPLHD